MATAKFWLTLKAQFDEIPDDPFEPLRAETGLWTADDNGVLPAVDGTHYWRLVGGSDESRSSFEQLATEGSKALGYKAIEWPAWLWRIRENRTWGDYTLTEAAPDHRPIGVVPDVIVASMRLCVDLALSPKPSRTHDDIQVARTRRAHVRDALKQKRWKLARWPIEANVEISQSALSDYLNGKSKLQRADVAQALAKALGLTQLPE